ncbi:P2 family phage major capsid protein [Escherichia coli]|nr:P2 family phage major capsid protein [Escherichia coli]HDI9609485.1 P2 family phage major capsid protein [Escherichia coli]
MTNLTKNLSDRAKAFLGIGSPHRDDRGEPENKITRAKKSPDEAGEGAQTTVTRTTNQNSNIMTFTTAPEAKGADGAEKAAQAEDAQRNDGRYAWGEGWAQRDSATKEKNLHEQKALNSLVEGFVLKSVSSLKMSGDASETVRVEKEGAEPVPARTLKLAESWSAKFLEKINILRLEDDKIEVARINTGGTIAGTGGDRHIRNTEQAEVTPRIYHLQQVNFDTQLSYQTLSGVSSGREGEFVTKALQSIERRKMLDVILTGITGTHHALLSSPSEHPNREDCGRGWLQAIREDAAARVYGGLSVSSVDQTGEIINVGNYASTDALVMDVCNTAIDQQFRNGLVAVCSSSFLSAKFFRLINNLSGSNAPNSEILIHQETRENPTLGGLPAVCVPFFPDNAVLITPLFNLSWYWQKGSWRKHFRHEPQFSRIAFYESVNACYVVEEYERVCLIEDIKFL